MNNTPVRVQNIKMLDRNKLMDINDKLIADHKIFAFLFMDANWNPHSPEDYNRDGGRSLFTELYMLYHDRGRKLLPLFCDNKATKHSNETEKMRHIFDHAPTPKNLEEAFRVIKSIFKDQFDSYNQFDLNVTKDDWKTLMNKFIADSNIFFDRLDSMANCYIPVQDIQTKFSQGMEQSMRLVLENYIQFALRRENVSCYEYCDKKQAIDYIKNNTDDVQKKIFDKFMNNMNSGIYQTSSDIHDGITQIFAAVIRDYILDNIYDTIISNYIFYSE